MELDLPTVISLVALAISLIGSLWLGAYRYGQLALKVDTLWGIFMKEAVSAALKDKTVGHNSPIHPNMDLMRPILGGLLPEILKARPELRKKPQIDQIIEIEKRWGKRLQDMDLDHSEVGYTSLLMSVHAIINDDR